MCVLGGVGWGGVAGVHLHLKFHNICSIGSTIYTTEAGVFTGSHYDWGLVCVFMCMCVSMCAVCACIGRRGGDKEGGSDDGEGGMQDIEGKFQFFYPWLSSFSVHEIQPWSRKHKNQTRAIKFPSHMAVLLEADLWCLT